MNSTASSGPTSVRLAVIGGGNMGAALVHGLLANGWATTDEIVVVEVSAERRAALEDLLPGVALRDTVPACSAALIAVKPNDAPAVVGEAVAGGATRILSIAAGVSLATLEAAAGSGVAVVRAMPNTPALVGLGAAAIAGGRAAGPDDLDWAESILASVGTVERVDEADLDAVTGLSGSGPGYLFLVAEALIAAGTKAGLDPAIADRLVRQLFVGSAALLAAGDDPAELRRRVTSPGGTTAAGLAVLETGGVRELIEATVAAAAARSVELGTPA